jgi:hypothetical protein
VQRLCADSATFDERRSDPARGSAVPAAAVEYAPAVDPEEGVVLTVVSGTTEADMLCGLLRSAGIDCAYRDTDAIDSTLEQFTQAGPQEVLVRESDLAAARGLLPDGAG